MIVVDLEMSGLDPHECGIVEIGAIELENPENIFNQLARLDDGDIIKNEPSADKTVLEVLGKTEEELRNPKLQSQKELLENFFSWVNTVEEKVFVCQNFLDLAYLTKKAKKLGLPRVHFRYLDLHTIAQIVYLQINKKLKLTHEGWGDFGLQKSARFCGLKDERGAHNALEDSKFEAEILNRLLKGENLLEEYKDFPIPEYLLK